MRTLIEIQVRAKMRKPNSEPPQKALCARALSPDYHIIISPPRFRKPHTRPSLPFASLPRGLRINNIMEISIHTEETVENLKNAHLPPADSRHRD
jgi:hypothetical protein